MTEQAAFAQVWFFTATWWTVCELSIGTQRSKCVQNDAGILVKISHRFKVTFHNTASQLSACVFFVFRFVFFIHRERRKTKLTASPIQCFNSGSAFFEVSVPSRVLQRTQDMVKHVESAAFFLGKAIVFGRAREVIVLD